MKLFIAFYAKLLFRAKRSHLLHTNKKQCPTCSWHDRKLDPLPSTPPYSILSTHSRQPHSVRGHHREYKDKHHACIMLCCPKLDLQYKKRFYAQQQNICKMFMNIFLRLLFRELSCCHIYICMYLYKSMSQLKTFFIFLLHAIGLTVNSSLIHVIPNKRNSSSLIKI